MLTVIPVVNTKKIAKEKYTKGSEKGIEIVRPQKKKKKKSSGHPRRRQFRRTRGRKQV